MARIYLSPPHVFGDEQALVADAFATNWIAPLGPHVDAFEREFAAAVGVPHAAALSLRNGRASPRDGFSSASGPGDRVICPSLTFSASANPICYQRAEPVFVDCDGTWTMDPALLEEALTACERSGRRAKAVIAVDLYGQCADYDAICAHVRPLRRPAGRGRRRGAGRDLQGPHVRRVRPARRLLVQRQQDHHDVGRRHAGVARARRSSSAARFLATQARDPAPHYEHSRVGYNYRLSNVLAAIGRGQLQSLD